MLKPPLSRGSWTVKNRSAKYDAGRQRVPPELRNVFDELVEDYKLFGKRHYGTTLVSYEIIADLILNGWRPTGEPRPILQEPSPD
jgi:hypothetical protein